MHNYQSIKSVIKYSTLSALALSSPLSAIERPTPAAQPEEKVAPALELQPEQIAQKAIPMPEVVDANKIAYFGVFGEPISDTLSAHLNLAEGIGLELELVAPNSPAANAELQKHDIILSLAGKDISSIDDLRASISDKKPGDIVELKYITKGKAVSKNITLAGRPVIEDQANHAPQRWQQRQQELGNLGLPKEFLDKFPEQDREKLMKLFRGNLQGLDLQELQQGLGKLEGFDFNLLPKGLNPDLNKGLNFQGSFQSRVKMVDEHGSITLESTKDGKVIELLDKAGKLQYRGPYNTEEEKQNVPKELRSRVENLDIDDGLGFLGKNRMNNNRQERMKQRLNALREMNNMNDIAKEFRQELPKDLQQKLNLNLRLPDINNLNAPKGAQKLEFKFGTNTYSTTKTDPQTGYRYTYKKENNKTQVEVTDANGKTLYGGPYNSDIDKASVPDEYRDFIEDLHAHSPKNPFNNGNKLKLPLDN